MKVSARTLLPILITTSFLALGVRIGDAWTSLHDGSLFEAAKPAFAEEKEHKETTAHEEKTEEEIKAPPAPLRRNHKDDAKPETPESVLFKQLSGRRDQLDKRAQGLDARESLIKVAEKRVDQKLQEMQSLRKQLEKLLGQASAEQQTQLENLVKIYEIMKPKEAARIFETLDMSVVLSVVKRMKPARTALILAQMNPRRAKDITTMLTRQNRLPQLK